MGFFVSQHGQLGAIPPPLFLSVSPLESMRSGGAIPPPQKGYLSDTCAIPYENKANGCDTPLCDTISKGYCAIWGGISHWAAKHEMALAFQGKHFEYHMMWHVSQLIEVWSTQETGENRSSFSQETVGNRRLGSVTLDPSLKAHLYLW